MQPQPTKLHTVSKPTTDYLFYGFLIGLVLLTFYVMLFAGHGATGHAAGDDHAHPAASGQAHDSTHK